MATQEKLYTVDDLWVMAHMPENKLNRLELIDGAIAITSPFTMIHGIIVAEVAGQIHTFVSNNGLGYSMVNVGFYLEKDRYNLRVSDIAFIKKERITELKEGYSSIMPDIAIEVKSPSNTFKELKEKAHYYLDNGVSLVWVIYPTSETVEVFTAIEADPLTLTTDDMLDGGHVLKGFSLAVKEIFP